MNKEKKPVHFFLSSLLNSYSQVFFSENKTLAILLLIISFFDLWAGISGLLSIIVANIVAIVMGYSTLEIKKGIYGFNPLLVGLGIGIYFAPAWNVLVLIVLAALLTFIISIILEGFFAKYGLPFLSVPFLLSIWLLMLAFPSLQNFGLSQRDLYTANELYSLGGNSLVKLYEWGNSIIAESSIRTYFLSLGGIFFQFNVISGFIIALGLLIHSRIHFLLSLLGFYTAFLFYQFLGVPSVSLNYSYYGFNFILSAIAIGGYFLIPSKSSFLWTIFFIPVLVILTIATDKLFGYFHLSVYSLPFNLVVLGFLYALKLRINKRGELVQPAIQQKNPETNLYLFQSNRKRFDYNFLIPISLPFYGEWTINQGFNGRYTHQDEWQHAWDFIIRDKQGNEYRNNGTNLQDYFCYEKSVLAPADGTVVEIIDSVDDNPIGEVNLKENWGNSIVIQHAGGLYSQMSHLKKGSFKITKGSFVKKGQILAVVGNSGRSPFPHLHFQFQSSPQVGSKTLKYHFQNYLKFSKNNVVYINSGIPEERQTISNISSNYMLSNVLNWVPGKKIKFSLQTENQTKIYHFQTDTTIYNQSYLFHKETNTYLYFKNDKNLFYAENFIGDKDSPLYLLFLALYKIPLGYYPHFKLIDNVPVHQIFNKGSLLVQDLIAPFYLYLNAWYEINNITIDSELNTKAIQIQSTINIRKKKQAKTLFQFVIDFHEKGIKTITVTQGSKKSVLSCIED